METKNNVKLAIDPQNVEVTVVPKAKQPDKVKTRSLDQILGAIKNNKKIKGMIQDLRNANGNQYKEMKRQLPQIIFAGVFERRADAAIKSYSGLLVVDLDSKDNPQVNPVETKPLLAQDPYIYVIFTSPSGKGLKLLVRVAEPIARVLDATVLKNSHKASAKAFFSYLEAVYGLKADESGTDLSRACFVSWDPELVINDEAQIFRFKDSSFRKEDFDDEVDFELIESALQAIPFGVDFPYHDWLRIGLALASTLGVDKAVELMHKYGNHPNDTEEFLYERFKNPNGSLGLGTVFWYAMQYGWKRPKSRKMKKNLVSGDGYDSDNSLVLIKASDIKPEPIEWIWKDRIARGKLHLIAGDPGLGKSQLAIYLAATVSRGACWADGKGNAPCGKVILICSEDDYASIVVPRLEAAGADRDKVVLLGGVNDGSQMFSLANPKHIQLLKEAIDEDTIMVVIDPISSFFGVGKVDTHKNSEVRGVLEPLNRIASEKNVAILAITHLNKQSHTNAKSKIAGSHAFVAAARIVYLVAPHPELSDMRVIVPVKTNIAKMPSGLIFGIKQKVTHDMIETSCIEWYPEMDVPWTADEILQMQGGKRRKNKITECEEWLRKELEFGPRKATEIFEIGKQHGFSEPTIKRAKKNLRIKTEKRGFQGEFYWELPDDLVDLDFLESDGNSNVISIGGSQEGSDIF